MAGDHEQAFLDLRKLAGILVGHAIATPQQYRAAFQLGLAALDYDFTDPHATLIGSVDQELAIQADPRLEAVWIISEILGETGGEIIPPSRRDSTASEGSMLANAAIGLAGCEDTTMLREATLAEVMLARHAMNLRRLVLRYTKALLMFIWTTIVGLVVAWQLGARDGQSRHCGQRPSQCLGLGAHVCARWTVAGMAGLGSSNTWPATPRALALSTRTESKIGGSSRAADVLAA